MPRVALIQKWLMGIVRIPELQAKLSPAKCPESSAALLEAAASASAAGAISGSFRGGGGGEEPRRGKGPQSRLRVHYHASVAPSSMAQLPIGVGYSAFCHAFITYYDT